MIQFRGLDRDLFLWQLRGRENLEAQPETTARSQIESKVEGGFSWGEETHTCSRHTDKRPSARRGWENGNSSLSLRAAVLKPPLLI